MKVLIDEDGTKTGTFRVTGLIGVWRSRLGGLKRDAYALFLACRDERTPWYAKLTAGAVVAYAFSPIDLIPDFIPVLGLLDDLLLVPLGVLLVRWMVPAVVMSDCRLRAESAFAAGVPVNKAAAGVIVVVWIALAWLSYRFLRAWL